MDKHPHQYELADEMLKRLMVTKIVPIKIFHPEFKNTNSIIEQLIEDKYVKLSADKLSLVITQKGERYISTGGHEKQFEREDIAESKLKIDLLIAERVYKTYWSTRFISWISFTIAVLLALLKFAEVLKLWPYHK
ncbi:MAG: hypothetical protein WKG06_06235 [Segetibacter sp.]